MSERAERLMNYFNCTDMVEVLKGEEEATREYVKEHLKGSCCAMHFGIWKRTIFPPEYDIERLERLYDI